MNKVFRLLLATVILFVSTLGCAVDKSSSKDTAVCKQLRKASDAAYTAMMAATKQTYPAARVKFKKTTKALRSAQCNRIVITVN